MRKSVIGTMGVTLSALVVLACGGIGEDETTVSSGGNGESASVETTAKPTAKMGGTLTVKESFPESKTTYTVKSPKQQTKSPDGLFDAENGTFYIVSAEIKVLEGNKFVHGGMFVLIPADGTVYEGTAGFGFKGTLDGKELNSGQRTSGIVVFDVPKAALKGARIELRNDLAQEASGYWTL
jgi:hypothetical protein